MRFKKTVIGIAGALLLSLTTAATAGVVSYQGRVELGGSPYSGPGYFKFAVVDGAGTTTLWSNNGSSVAGSEPSAGVTLPVTNGLFDVLLGDATLTNMTDLPGSAFPVTGAARMLRVWFSTTNAPGSFSLLAPDRRVSSVPIALQAEQAQTAQSAVSAGDAFNLGGVPPANWQRRVPNPCGGGQAVSGINADGTVNCVVLPVVPAGAGERTIPFSTGVIISGASMVAAAPRLMGFGNNTVEIISGLGESTTPPEAAGFSFPIPSDGVLQDLQIGADLLVASVASINVTPLTYNFQVFRAPSVPSTGFSHLASPYVTTALTSSVTFGGPGNIMTAGLFYSATNLAIGPLVVSAGDRIGIRVRTSLASDPSAADITQLSFNASLVYKPN